MDAAAVAVTVRTLARRARRALAHPADESEARDLCEAIEDLERRLDTEAGGELGRWLASLRHRLEARIVATV